MTADTRSLPIVGHSDPILEFFLAPADGPITVNGELGADSASGPSFESQPKSHGS
jgi:hypothetical protein